MTQTAPGSAPPGLGTPSLFRASLSGSGSKLGYHVGILIGYQEDLGWRCEEYRGCSGGGLIAAFAACGRLRWCEDLLGTLATADVYGTAGLWGLYRGNRYTLDPLMATLARHHVWDFVVETPCSLIVYDLQLQQGLHHRLLPGDMLGAHRDALIGTMSVPGLFPPTHAGRWVDGGVIEAVPDIESPSAMVRSPWVVSVAMSVDLPTLPAPPSSMKQILIATIAGVSAETVRNDLKWAGTETLHRLHQLPRPEQYASFDFDPARSRRLIEDGRADVHVRRTRYDARALRVRGALP
jgi:patatin-like phospholipase